jgi:hypothetical protein
MEPGRGELLQAPAHDPQAVGAAGDDPQAVGAAGDDGGTVADYSGG